MTLDEITRLLTDQEMRLANLERRIFLYEQAIENMKERMKYAEENL